MRYVIYGPPGTGKTTFLLNRLEEYLARGVHPTKIGFISFTRKAAYEARDRAISRFGFGEEDTPYFRTLHSLAFRQLGLSHHQVMQRAHYLDLADKLGIEIRAHLDMAEGSLIGSLPGDYLVFLDSLARLRCIPLKEQWEHTNDERIDWHELDLVSRSLTEYKKRHLLLDYTDMLERCYVEGSLPQLDVLFVDETQDLSTLQWNLVERLSSNATDTYFAGDDDQAIFSWAGANVERFIRLDGDKLVLNQSYRIPNVVHQLAGQIVSSIDNRAKKVFKPRACNGDLQYHCDVDSIDLSSGEWLCLARSRNQLKTFEQICRQGGFHYELFDSSPAWTEEYQAIRAWNILSTGKEIPVSSAKVVLKYAKAEGRNFIKKIDDQELVDMGWLIERCQLKNENKPWSEALTGIHVEDVEYFDMAMKNENLDKRPRIKISTIHGVKGGEADNVVILSDVYQRVFDAFQVNPDDEHRVFYVGVTRARENLHVVNPKTPRNYPL